MRCRDKKQSDYERCLAAFKSAEQRAYKACAEMTAAFHTLRSLVHSDSIPDLSATSEQPVELCIPSKFQESNTVQRHEQLTDDFLQLRKEGMSAQKAWTKLADMPGTMLAPDTVRDIVTRNITGRILRENQILQKKNLKMEERAKLLSKQFNRSLTRIKRLIQKAARKES
jgi:hypothetical protein